MTKKISIAIAVVIALVLGAVGGYFYNNKSSESSVLTDGEYSVTASWNWKKLNVSGDTYTLDGSRKYEVLAQNKKNGTIVINSMSGMDEKSTQVYKIIQSGEKFEWHVVANGKVTDKVAATVSKNE